MLKTSLVILLFCIVVDVARSEEIKIPGTPTDQRLPIELIRKAITNAGKTYSYPYTNLSGGVELSFTRMMQDIESGNLDVMYSMTSDELEEQFLAVYIPLYRGLLGMRIPIVNKGNENMFSGVRSLNELAKFKAGSGKFWPDTKILENGGLLVVKTLKYNNLFLMLEGKRFDYFPRGLNEPWQEIIDRPELNLAVEKNLLLRYTAPTYFFVAKNNKKLADFLTNEFNKMIVSGEFSELFFANAEIQSALQKSQVQNRIVFDLENPSLSDKTPLHRKELWFDPRKGQ